MDSLSDNIDTLCYGGTFNPVHVGHLTLVRMIARSRRYARVLLIPAGDPPHKPADSELAPASDRLEMCRLASADAEDVGVDDLEIRRPGPSYTIDTVRALRSRGIARIGWLVGADWLPRLPTWRCWDQLRNEVEFLVARRPGFEIDFDSLPESVRSLRDHVVETPLIDVSSTEIRRRVRAGEPIAGLVHPAVERYIRERGLYR